MFPCALATLCASLCSESLLRLFRGKAQGQTLVPQLGCRCPGSEGLVQRQVIGSVGNAHFDQVGQSQCRMGAFAPSPPTSTPSRKSVATTAPHPDLRSGSASTRLKPIHFGLSGFLLESWRIFRTEHEHVLSWATDLARARRWDWCSDGIAPRSCADFREPDSWTLANAAALLFFASLRRHEDGGHKVLMLSPSPHGPLLNHPFRSADGDSTKQNTVPVVLEVRARSSKSRCWLCLRRRADRSRQGPRVLQKRSCLMSTRW